MPIVVRVVNDKDYTRLARGREEEIRNRWQPCDRGRRGGRRGLNRTTRATMTRSKDNNDG